MEGNGIKAAASPAGSGVFGWLLREFDLVVAEEDAAKAKELLEDAGDVLEAFEVAEEDSPS